MKINCLRPMLHTEDFDGTVSFYTDVLGFKTDNVRSDWGWASMSIDDAEIMITVPLKFDSPAECPQPDKIGFSGSFYFNTDDVDALWHKLKDITTVCYGIENFEHGMREFAVYDNNGYILQFGQEIEGN